MMFSRYDLLCQVTHAINTCSRCSFTVESEDQNFADSDMYGGVQKR